MIGGFQSCLQLQWITHPQTTLLLGGELLHMRCVCNIINLIVSDGLQELDLSILAIRNAVRYVRSSPARLRRFKECVRDEKVESTALLSLDVPTRWNSTYLMLKVSIPYQKVITLFLNRTTTE